MAPDLAKEAVVAYDITTVEEPDELVASIRRRVARDEIPAAIPAAFGRLGPLVQKAGWGDRCRAS